MTTAANFWQCEQDGDRYCAQGDFDRARARYREALELRPEARWIARKLASLLEGASPETDLSRLNLFIPWYTPGDKERAEELRYCLDRNLDSGIFAKIVLMIDDETIPHRNHPDLLSVRLAHRPRYQDWLTLSGQHCPGQIAILANSDIHFDDSVAGLVRLFDKDRKAFVALSRFDRKAGQLVPHPNPHWSQDVWALIPEAKVSERLVRRTDIPLGVPRCDNRIAYVFATEGYTVYNPFPFIRSIHVHETQIRYYSKTGDRSLIGGMAMVNPGSALDRPADLIIELWSESSAQIKEFKINKTLERWAEIEKTRPAWLAHDADWQYPAITEQHAFQRVRAILDKGQTDRDAVYLGFPFATLIDLRAQLGAEHPRTRALQEALDGLAAELTHYKRVVTVCQHIRGREHAEIFAKAGVTDLFWSHLTANESEFAAAPGMRLRPFPLYPVQQSPRRRSDIDRPRKWLFSFVGARAQKNYLSQVRSFIIEQLADHPNGRIIDRANWHYQKVVYEAQVFQRAAGEALVDDAQSEMFRAIMDDSIFTLCPSGSGPNSIRLWEAMVNGSIPVIMADSWAAPGDPALWAAATVRCAETAEAVAALPDRLAAIAADPMRLRQMRESLLVLAEQYGPDGFVTDVAKLMGAP